MRTFWLIFAATGLLAFFAPRGVAGGDIETEFERMKSDGGGFLTMVGTAKGEENLPYLIANTSLPGKTGDELMRITHKPDGRDGKRFRHYYFRNGSVELIHDHSWNAPKDSMDFRREAERRLRVDGDKIASQGVPLEPPSEGAKLLADGKRFYEMIKAKQRR